MRIRIGAHAIMVLNALLLAALFALFLAIQTRSYVDGGYPAGKIIFPTAEYQAICNCEPPSVAIVTEEAGFAIHVWSPDFSTWSTVGSWGSIPEGR